MKSYSDFKDKENNLLEILSETNLSDEQRINIHEFMEKCQIYQSELLTQNDELIEKDTQLTQAKEEYEQLFSHTPIPCIKLNEKHLIIKFNHEAEHFLFKHTSYKYSSLLSLFINKTDIRKFFTLLSEAKRVGNSSGNLTMFEEPFISTVHMNVNYLKKDKPYYLITLVDITKIIQQEKELKDTATKLFKKEMEIIDMYEKTIYSMVDMIEQRDFYTGGHSQRVSEYAVKIALKLNLDSQNILMLKQIGLLHDIGKIAIPDSILLKPGKLNKQERAIIEEHPKIGYEIISKIPIFKDFAENILYHHERYDGKGYPKGLKGDEIPFKASILSVADSFDAMTTTRIYHKRFTPKEALEEIKKDSKKAFHPDVVDAAIEVLSDIKIDDYKIQLPENEIEDSRFAYFFKDSLTGLFNKRYLELILQKENYKYIYKISIKNFSKYNKKLGWDEGDLLLRSIKYYLEESFPKIMKFRIHGDNFILLSNEKIEEINLDKKIETHNLISFKIDEIEFTKNRNILDILR